MGASWMNKMQVSYLLLLFFCGMFIVVEGFQATGIPGEMWDFTEPYARVTTPTGILVLSLVILVLSNLVSNVPTGMSPLMPIFSIFLVLSIY